MHHRGIREAYCVWCKVARLRHRQDTDLQVSRQHWDELEVVVVSTERVEEGFGDLEPTDVEKQLKEGEEGKVEVDVVTRVSFCGIEELLPDQREEEERIHCQGHHLQEATRSVGGLGSVMMKLIE